MRTISASNMGTGDSRLTALSLGSGVRGNGGQPGFVGEYPSGEEGA